MLLLRRTGRRIKGFFGSLRYHFVRFVQNVRFHFRLWRLGSSERYIRRAFSYLAQLDMDDWYKTNDGLRIKAAGVEVHIIDEKKSADPKHPTLLRVKKYEFVLFQDHNFDLVVHEWRDQTRPIAMEIGPAHETHWWEIFRSGCRVDNLKFLPYLTKLYGEGEPCLKSKRLPQVKTS